ncbi:hypothetical protein ACX0G7_01730 [Flavitalea antarctica]
MDKSITIVDAVMAFMIGFIYDLMTTASDHYSATFKYRKYK